LHLTICYGIIQSIKGKEKEMKLLILITICIVGIFVCVFEEKHDKHDSTMQKEHKMLLDNHEKMFECLKKLNDNDKEINKKLDILLNIATNRTVDFN
jgi:hypothetical protein